MKCLWCETEFTLKPGRHGKQKYCSRTCRIKGYNKSYEEKRKILTNIWRKNHPEHKIKDNLRQQNRTKRIRQEIFSIIGNKCSNPDCPIPPEKLDLRTLQIDHIHGGGEKERNSFKSKTKYYLYILEQVKNGSKNYQPLCPYCNWLKRFINHEHN